LYARLQCFRGKGICGNFAAKQPDFFFQKIQFPFNEPRDVLRDYLLFIVELSGEDVAQLC